MNKRISILGATGSVGTQALDVARRRGYRVDFLSANVNISALECAAREFRPYAVGVADEASAAELKLRLADTDTKVLSGEAGIAQGIISADSDIYINSTLGKAGLAPTLAVIDAGKPLALANKESLVVAGDIVMSRAKERGVDIIPVDSEHSAIFQSMRCGGECEVKRIILTASGGPFFGKSAAELREVTLEDALAHPTWKMGKKITVDSATLMNKGFEIIEASHLFGVSAERVEVVVHRESILHSAVEYIDNAIIGQMAVPDMRMCIKYAIDYPNRLAASVEPLDLFKVGALTFFEPDTKAFPLLALARRAAIDGGASGAVLNAVDEVAVDAFLQGKIKFSDISHVVGEVYEALPDAKDEGGLDAVLYYDAAARRIAAEKASELI